MISKDEIRKINKQKRANASKEEVLEKSQRAANHFLASDFYKDAKRIMLYIPLGNELDLGRVMEKAFEDQKTVLVPVTDEETGDITPCYAHKDDEFLKGAFSVLEPKEKICADIERVDIVLVPGIAFDTHGGRVGFGKGCFDRLLGKSNAVFVGVCFDFQIADEIELEKTDVKMDFLLTESGFLKCK